MTSQAVRYAPINLASIPGYPNKIPLVNWQHIFQDSMMKNVMMLPSIYLDFISIYISWEWDGMKILQRNCSCIVYKDMQGLGMRDF